MRKFSFQSNNLVLMPSPFTTSVRAGFRHSVTKLVTTRRKPLAASTVSSYFGDAYYILLLGQVSCFSNVTFQIVIMTVTVNIVAKRGCDFVMFNMVNELAGRGILGTVLTRQRAFAS
ncbi:indole-3-acetamide hydrolase [Colletotrichum incanum]|uniref:Indole-3-acetamide hydrolase n=1 Tax=Colletotrichum incanum TaxID=1573173 RepID=A0A167E0V9_COLIC|nr:indole-3-acetamide hydrolase [Colletotrichum incanum]